MKIYPKRACPVCRKLVSTAGLSFGPHVAACRLKEQLAKVKPSKVVAVRQSPMSATRWSLDLDCGHDVWVGGKTKPTRKTFRCHQCATAARYDIHHEGKP